MADEGLSFAGPVSGGPDLEPEVVEISTNPVTAILRAVASAQALALVGLILATATMLEESIAADFGDVRLYSDKHANDLSALKWDIAARLAIAIVAFVLSIIAGVIYSRRLPRTRYTFIDGSDESIESTAGDQTPPWISLLVGASFLMSAISVVLHVIALIYAAHHHYHSPTLF